MTEQTVKKTEERGIGGGRGQGRGNCTMILEGFGELKVESCKPELQRKKAVCVCVCVCARAGMGGEMVGNGGGWACRVMEVR